MAKLDAEKEKNIKNQAFALHLQKQVDHYVQALKNEEKDQTEEENDLKGLYYRGVRFAINKKAAEYPEKQAKFAPTN